jgi:hypothetical protein
MRDKTFISFDWALKRLLRDKANFGVLEGFVSTLLERPVKIHRLLESEGNKDRDDAKLNRVDLLAEDSDGELLLVEAVELYLSDMQEKHGGLREVRISDNVGRCDTLPAPLTPGKTTAALPPQTSGKTTAASQSRTPIVYAFLLLCYGDSTQEEIAVPMVEQGGLWLMR